MDALSAPHVDIVGPVDRLPYHDEQVGLIYASHVLEHFGRHQYLSVLEEWHRVLSPGGELRLAVPDFDRCARLYLEGVFGENISQSALIGLICGGQKDAYDFHKMIFDEKSLSDALLSVGFSSVSRWDWRLTEHAQVDDFSQAYVPHLQKNNGVLVSLNLMAIK